MKCPKIVQNYQKLAKNVQNCSKLPKIERLPMQLYFTHCVYLINCIYPSPVSAQHAWICHPWLRMDWRLRSFEISAALKQPLTSCLLAKTKILALLSSSWPIILCNSSLVMLNLSRSVESTTKITNWKKKCSNYNKRQFFKEFLLSELHLTTGLKFWS